MSSNSNDPATVTAGFFVIGAALASAVFRSVIPLVVVGVVFILIGAITSLTGSSK